MFFPWSFYHLTGPWCFHGWPAPLWGTVSNKLSFQWQCLLSHWPHQSWITVKFNIVKHWWHYWLRWGFFTGVKTIMWRVEGEMSVPTTPEWCHMDQDFTRCKTFATTWQGEQAWSKVNLSISKESTTVMYHLETAGIHQAFKHHFSFVGHTKNS